MTQAKTSTKNEFKYDVKFSARKTPVANSKKVFERTQEALNNFYRTYNDGTKGAPSHSKQDLLRVMVVFACAGLDSFLKQLVTDCLELIINTDEGASENFRNFVEKRIKNKNYFSRISPKGQEGDDPMVDFDYAFLSTFLCSNEPKKIIMEEYKKGFNGSLQSVEEASRVGKAFAIGTSEILGKIDMKDFKKVFDARNKIAHELDITFEAQSKWDTRKRSSAEILEICNYVLIVMQNFVMEVDKKLYPIKK